jgi:hypothetical protein
MGEIPFINYWSSNGIVFEGLNVFQTNCTNGQDQMQISFLVQSQISNSGIISIGPYDRGLHVSDNTILQFKPERNIGQRKAEGKYVKLTFKYPIDDQHIYFYENPSVEIDNVYGEVVSDYNPLERQLSTKITIPDNVHYFNSSITYNDGNLQTIPYNFFGGINNPPSLTFGIGNKTTVIGKNVIIPINIIDFDGDTVSWTLTNGGSFLTSGVATGTINYTFTPMTSGLKTLVVSGTDSFGASAVSAPLYIDVIEDNVPSGFFVTQSHTSFPSKREFVEFNLADLDFDTISFELYCNGNLSVSGTSTKEMFMKYPFQFPKGTYHFTLILKDIFVDSDVINGPIINVIDQVNVSNY